MATERQGKNMTKKQILAISLGFVLSAVTLMTRAQTEVTNADGEADLPPKAKPGECYARVLVSADYKTVSKRVLKQEASEKIEIISAKYETREEKILIKEASEKIEVTEAEYEWTEERVLVKEASEELVAEPAVYRAVPEQVMIRPAYTVWKTGRGPIERVDNTTGEIMCLVEVPAEYTTMEKQVVEQPAKVVKKSIPAEYKTVRKQVMVKPPDVKKVEIPAEYETIQIQRLIEPAKEIRVEVPAVYETVTENIKITDSRMLWRPILCETNVTPDVIQSLQRALQKAGFNPGTADGRVGDQTRQALADFQKSKGLAQGQLTIETLKALGIQKSI
jgi:regulator of extracellular matrix RemA (YlzA/DUF370 family)